MVLNKRSRNIRFMQDSLEKQPKNRSFPKKTQNQRIDQEVRLINLSMLVAGLQHHIHLNVFRLFNQLATQYVENEK